MSNSELKKRGSEEPLGGGDETSPGLPLKIKNDTFEVSLVENLFVLGSAQKKGAAANVVDLAGHSLGVIVDATDEAVAKDLVLAASDVEMVLDVTGGLFEVERAEMITDGDTLVESLVGSEAQLACQVRLAEQDEGERGGGVHLVVEQEAELVKDVRGQEMGFVDDREHETSLAGEIGESGTELRQELGKGVGRLGLESEKDLAIEGGDGEMRVGEVDDGVEVVVERMDESAEGSGLAGTDVAGDESREALLEGEREAALDFAVAARGEKVWAGDGPGERGRVETVGIIQSSHCFLSPWDRVIRVG
jgi:hypothetical protein